ncbi:hypothetical protein PENTCL1PPCAC_2339, partial [Pristionchus entomophagus]
SHDINSYVINRSFGLGTSKRGSILPSHPTATIKHPRFLCFSLENFDEQQIYQKDVIGHYGCINALEFSPNEEMVVSGGDDRRVCIWATDELLYNKSPKMRGKMARKHYSNIFALAFDPDSRVVYSAGNDYYFVSSDITSGAQLFGMQGTHGVHDISVNMRSGEVLVTRCGGRDALYFHDPRTNRPTATITIMADYRGRAQIYSAQFNPDPSSSLIGMCGEEFGVCFRDRRNLAKPLFSRDPCEEGRNAMYGGWNRNGTKFAHLVSKGAPRVYDFKECAIYDMSPSTYKNSHTIKSIEWLDDDWFVTGSDDFNIYGWCTKNLTTSQESRQESDTRFKLIWKDDSERVPRACLVGHRSIVNHARFSSRYQFLVSSGVEKIIKVWNNRSFPDAFVTPRLRRKGTMETVGEEGSGLLRRRGNGGRFRRKKTAESGRMLRYFDSLIAMDDGDIMSEDGLDSGSSDESLSEEEDEDSSSGGQGISGLVEDTDSRDGIRRIPDTRLIFHNDRSIIVGGDGEEEEDLMMHPYESDTSDGELDVTMDDQDESDSTDDDVAHLPLAGIRMRHSGLFRYLLNRPLSSLSSSSDSSQDNNPTTND